MSASPWRAIAVRKSVAQIGSSAFVYDERHFIQPKGGLSADPREAQHVVLRRHAVDHRARYRPAVGLLMRPAASNCQAFARLQAHAEGAGDHIGLAHRYAVDRRRPHGRACLELIERYAERNSAKLEGRTLSMASLINGFALGSARIARDRVRVHGDERSKRQHSGSERKCAGKEMGFHGSVDRQRTHGECRACGFWIAVMGHDKPRLAH
jgi:hypothetical protein